MRRRSFLPLGFALAAVPAFGDMPMCTLRVEVKTLKDKPIERASVVLDFLEGRNLMKLGRKDRRHWETKTGQDGVAKLPPIPQGKVKVVVIASGYQTFGNTFEITEEEKTIEIKLNPPQAPYSVHQ